MPRTRFEAVRDKQQALRDAEADGAVTDSQEVRLALMRRVHSGELTLAQAQSELRKMQSRAHSSGKLTRAQAYNRG